MKKLLAVIAFVTTSAYAQFDHSLFRVIPDHGPVTGGTTVTVEGSFNFTGLADPCIGPRVWIGGRPVPAGIRDDTHMVIETQPYTAGTFDLKVDICGAEAVMKNAFTYGEPWERVLLPVYLSGDVPGAHGSIWRTDLAAAAWPSAAVTGEPQIACAQPGTFCEGLPSSDHHVPGRIIYLGPGQIETRRTSVNLRVRDISRVAESLGTELRAVREDDAFGPGEVIVMPNIPVGQRYRGKLRVYRIDTGEPSRLEMAVTTANGATVLAQQIQLSAEPMTGAFLRYPSYAEFDLEKVPVAAEIDQLTVSLITPQEGIYWAFVAVTNNETQQITTVSPR